MSFKDWKRTGLLALAGMIGFGMPAIVSLWMWLMGLYPGIVNPPSLAASALLVVMLAVGGALLGAALGYLEKGRAD